MIHLSQAAINEVQRMKSKQANPNLAFRLGVRPGGCGDFYYTLNLDEPTVASDHILMCDGVQVIVDAQSWQYLTDLSLDYSEDLMGGGFRFNNPNVVSSCGCGNSFSIENSASSGEGHSPAPLLQ